MRVILPKTKRVPNYRNEPLFFLAGPIRGGGDWQLKCCEELQRHIKNFDVAIPCRYKEGHPLWQYKVEGFEGDFDRQLTWERQWLTWAAYTGCIIFWLPCESQESPRSRLDDCPYAMDTRGELGEWRGRLMNPPDYMKGKEIRIVIGAEPEFPGLSQIQRNFNEALDKEFPIYSTLTDTVKAAVAKALVPV